MCRQGTLKELFQQCAHVDAVVESSDNEETHDGDHVAKSMQDDVATCPVCSQAVPAENAAFNQHIDVCLNSSTIQEALSEESLPSRYQCSDAECNTGLLKTSPKKPYFNIQGDGGCCSLRQNCESTSSSSCQSTQTQKRKALGNPSTPNKKITLDHYFSRHKL